VFLASVVVRVQVVLEDNRPDRDKLKAWIKDFVDPALRQIWRGLGRSSLVRPDWLFYHRDGHKTEPFPMAEHVQIKQQGERTYVSFENMVCGCAFANVTVLQDALELSKSKAFSAQLEHLLLGADSPVTSKIVVKSTEVLSSHITKPDFRNEWPFEQERLAEMLNETGGVGLRLTAYEAASVDRGFPHCTCELPDKCKLLSGPLWKHVMEEGNHWMSCIAGHFCMDDYAKKAAARINYSYMKNALFSRFGMEQGNTTEDSLLFREAFRKGMESVQQISTSSQNVFG
jgi:hypothetical protein